MSEEHDSNPAEVRRGAEADGPIGFGSVLVDRYELGEVLGQGGMADVYRGVDRLLGRAVAIKILRSNADDETALARFTSEARTLAGLSHSRLVVVLDAGFASHRPFIVMELVDGPTLAQVIAGGPLPFPQLVSVGVQVAQALAHAHEAGVVHRDVKPGNVLMGSDGHVKLADFGIARLVDDAVRHTQTGMSIGTAAYLSPEQVRGEAVTVAADVYSLALVLIEAATGERVFPGTLTESAIARLHRDAVIPKGLPPQWRSVLARMSALEPSARPTAAEVAGILRLPNAAVTSGWDDPATSGVGPAGAGDDMATMLLTQATPAPGATGRVPTVAAGGEEAGREEAGGEEAGREEAGHPVGSPGASTPESSEPWGQRLRELPTQLRAGAAVAAALMTLMVIVGVVAANDRQSNADELPDQVPSRFEGPLRDLHDAVDGN